MGNILENCVANNKLVYIVAFEKLPAMNSGTLAFTGVLCSSRRATCTEILFCSWFIISNDLYILADSAFCGF